MFKCTALGQKGKKPKNLLREVVVSMGHAKDPGHATRNMREDFWGVVSVLQSPKC